MFDINWSQLHFIREQLLFIYLICLVLCVLLYFASRHIAWSKFIAPEILQALKVSDGVNDKKIPIILAIVYLISCIALAGPTWKESLNPSAERTDAVVLVFDLSPSMRATDIAPSRYSRAKLKIIDLLRQRREGQTALVAYAGSAHIVSPLSTDARTLLGLVQSLSPDVLPVPGSNTEQAIAMAIELLNSADVVAGHIVLVTDGIAEKASTAVLQMLQGVNYGHRLSILGVGTTSGSPIPMQNGQFLKDTAGRVVFSKLKPQLLSSIAYRSDGRYKTLTNDEQDLSYLLDEDFADQMYRKFRSGEQPWFLQQQNQQWYDSGAAILLLLLPFSILALRRSALILLLTIALFPTHSRAQEQHQQATETKSFALSLWDKLTLNKQQQALKLLKNGNAKSALPLFENENWRAAANFYSGDFKAAEQYYSSHKDDAHQTLNSMKSLFMQKDIPSAIARTELAEQLAEETGQKPLQKKIQDYRKLLEYLMQQQQQQNQQQQKDQEQQDQDQDQEQQKQQQQQNQEQQQKEQEQEQEQEQQQQQNEEEQQQMPTEEELEQLKRMRWLENIKDDPSGFLRRKFKYQVENEERKDVQKKPRY